MLKLTFFDLDALSKEGSLPEEVYSNFTELQNSERLVAWTKKKFDDKEFAGFGLALLGPRTNLIAYYGSIDPDGVGGYTGCGKIVAFVDDPATVETLKQVFSPIK